eukprot:jgi/Bigna1/89297/estExt_fgenesh1_pg.C_460140
MSPRAALIIVHILCTVLIGTEGIEFYPRDVPLDVRNLNPVTYKELVLAGIDTKGGKCFHVVKFYSSAGDVNLDPHFARSVRLRSYIIEAAAEFRNTAAVVSAIDWETKANRALFREQGIKRRHSLPVVKIFAPDGSSEVFTGKYDELVEYVKIQVQSYVKRNRRSLMPKLRHVVANTKVRAASTTSTTSTFESFMEKQGPGVIFAYEPKRGGEARVRAEQTAAALALNFHGKLRFAKTSDKKVVKLLDSGSGSNTIKMPVFFFIYEKYKKEEVEEGPKRGVPLKAVAAYPSASPSYESLQAWLIEILRQVKRSLITRVGVVTTNAIHIVWANAGLYGEWVKTMFGLEEVGFTRIIAWWPTKKLWAPYIKAVDNVNELTLWLETASLRGAKGILPSPEPILYTNDYKTYDDHYVDDDESIDAAVERVGGGVAANFSTDDPAKYPGDKVCLWMSFGVAPDQLRTDDFNRRVEVQLRERSSSSWMDEEGKKQQEKGQDTIGSRKHLYRFARPRNKWGVSYNLTAATFFDNVVESPSHWLVWFNGGFGYNNHNNNDHEDDDEDEDNGAGYNKQRLEAWNKAAKLMRGKVQFGMISAYERADEILASIGLKHTSSSRSSSSSSSSILLFPARTLWGNKKSKVQASVWLREQSHPHQKQQQQQQQHHSENEDDGFTTLDPTDAIDIVRFANSLFEQHPNDKYKKHNRHGNSHDAVVFRVDNSEPSQSIQAWISDGSVKPRLLLFPNKDIANNIKVPTLLQALAIEFGHIMHCALAKRSDEKLAHQAQVTRFPAVRILSTTAGKGGRFGEMKISDYEGDINFNSLARFLDSNTRIVAKHHRNKDEL